MDSINTFLTYKSFEFSYTFSVKKMKWERGYPRYHFNCGERAGNFLLEPLKWVFTVINTSNSKLKKLVAVVCSLFAAIFALFGFAIKKMGELQNPQSLYRYQAIEKLNVCLQRIYDVAQFKKQNDISQDATVIFLKIDLQKSAEKIISDKHKISADTSLGWWLLKLKQNEQEAVIMKEMGEFNQKLEIFLYNLSKDVCGNEEIEILEMVRSDAVTSSLADKFFEFAKVWHRYNKACLEYYSVVEQLEQKYEENLEAALSC